MAQYPRLSIMTSFIMVMATMIGCSRGASTQQSGANASGGDQKNTETMSKASPTISATPNPVPAGDGFGSTTISWDTGGGFGQVYVSENGGPDDKLLVEKARGSKEVKWIQTGHTYEFRLYSAKDRQTLLAKVLVTRATQ